MCGNGWPNLSHPTPETATLAAVVGSKKIACMSTRPTRLLIVKLGSTLPGLAESFGDFEHWIADGLRSAGIALEVSVCDPRAEQPLPSLTLRPAADRPCDGVLLTGSHDMVSHREAWSEHTAAWLRDAVYVGLPVLGICYGHQLLAHALGGVVDDHPEGLECGTTTIWRKPSADGDPLFDDLPTHWLAQVAHRQTVLQLPQGAVALADNRFEPHQAFRFGACAWGVQFHPEFSTEVTKAYVAHLADQLEAQDLNPAAALNAVQATPDAADLLPRFARWVHQHRLARPPSPRADQTAGLATPG